MAVASVSRSVRIVPANTKRERKRFIALAHAIYADRPEWRAPLRLERALHLSEKHNPSFEHLEWQAWIAVRDGRDVGRISAQVDTLRRETYDENVGYFGLFECIDDADVAAALLATAEAWLAERGMAAVHGPFNLTINDECGLLIDGFDTPPMAMMPHGHAYYPGHVEAAGYTRATDMIAYWLELPFARPRAMTRLLERYAKRVTVRPIRRKDFAAELERIRDIFNDAWAGNWGFVPLTEAEFSDMGNTLKHILDDELIQIAEVDGVAAAFIVGLPNINEAARDLDGRLSPAGLAKLIWRLKVRFPSSFRVPLMGVRQTYQGGPLGAALAFGVIAAMEHEMMKRGAYASELSWILADNRGMRDIIEAIGGQPYKTYRIYEKRLR